ncbi:MAG: DUF998 domain-containing protein [Candidatus Helarchaeota archaeon]
MEKNPLKWPISCIAGLLVIIFYCTFTFISIAMYPVRYSPLSNWLSDLGNMFYNFIDISYLYFEYNPQGGIFYNLGCIFTGILLVPFFIGLYVLYDDEKVIGMPRKIWAIIIQIIGLFSGFALVMIGVFSEDQMPAHSMWSRIFFIAIVAVLVLVSITFYTYPGFFKALSYYGIILAIVDAVFVFLGLALVEWITVFSALGFVGLLSYNILKIKST